MYVAFAHISMITSIFLDCEDTMGEKDTNYLSKGTISAIEAASENIILRIINKGIEFVDAQNKQLSIQTGEAFKTYLDKAYRRLNQMRTLATGYDTVSIVGKDSIYVDSTVRYVTTRGSEISNFDVISVEDLLTLDNNNILITGTGGAGKTMLMKYLFLNTRNRGKYVPVYLELRKITKQKNQKISIEDFIYSCMESHDIGMTRDMLDYSLGYGGYVFLFDGYDEVKESFANEASEAIQQFCSKYDQNIYIVTSRENNDLMALFQTFSVVTTVPLDLEKAKRLAQRLGGDSESNQAFCLELDKELYYKYEDFAGNPLLLTMMYLVYMRNGSVPDYLVDFYSQCFDALYSRHDSFHKGNYKRELKCKDLPENDFKQIFSKFCFVTYFKSQYEFKRSNILALLRTCIGKSTDKMITAEDFLADLQEAVCLLVKDGEVYRFVHRSFQTYFATVHVDGMNDNDQKQLVEMDLNKATKNYVYLSYSLTGSSYYISNMDIYQLLYQMNAERFLQNIVAPVLHEFMIRINNGKNPDIELLRFIYGGVDLSGELRDIHSITGVGRRHKEVAPKYYRIHILFDRLVMRIYRDKLDYMDGGYLEIFNEMRAWVYNLPTIRTNVDSIGRNNEITYIPFGVIDWYLQENPTDTYFEDLAQRFYEEVCRVYDISGMRKTLNNWLAQQEQKRKKVEDANDFDSLVDSLI